MHHFLLNRFGKFHGLALFGLILTLTVATTVWGRDEPAPVIEAANQPGIPLNKANELDNRVTRLERQMDSQALFELMTRIEGLRDEMQGILSQVEEQGFNIEGLQKRQRDLYLDIDQRLRKLEEDRTAGAGKPSVSTGQSATVPAAPGSNAMPGNSVASQEQSTGAQASDAERQLERKAYEQAFNLLKDGQYDTAIASFKAFVQTYPSGRYAANAQYWLGEANYVQRRFADALAEFDRVVKNFPDSNKRADAMLKMGYTYQELGDNEQARVILNGVIRDYPNSTAANLAKKRLQDLK